MYILLQDSTAGRGEAFEFVLFLQLKSSPGVFTGMSTKIASETSDKNLQEPFGAAQNWTRGTQTDSNSQMQREEKGFHHNY